ncbi:MAG: ATP-binding cassette domain-containing protein [Eubacteriaceae bacterium]
MLRIKNLCKNIGTRPLLKSININVDEGMIYGFIGHNGAGKTTTMRAIVGLTRFNSGEIIIEGKSYMNKVAIDHIVGYLPENPNFYSYMTAKEYMRYLSQLNNDSKLIELLEMVGLKKSMNKRIGTYSRGMKQRLGMAAVMIHNPKLLIMDEPTSALDPAGRYELFEMIKQLRDKGSTIILSTHILDDIEKVSDKIGIIKEGAILREGNVDEILSDYFHPIYDVKTENLDNFDLNYFNKYPWIDEVIKNGQMLSITVRDIDYAKHQMLQSLLDSKLNVVGFDLRQPSLEDVFIKESRL